MKSRSALPAQGTETEHRTRHSWYKVRVLSGGAKMSVQTLCTASDLHIYCNNGVFLFCLDYLPLLSLPAPHFENHFVPLRGERKRSRPTQVQEAAEPDAPIDSLGVNTCHAAATDSTKSSRVPSNPLLNGVSGTLWTPQFKTHWSSTTSREKKNTPRSSDNTAHPNRWSTSHMTTQI